MIRNMVPWANPSVYIPNGSLVYSAVFAGLTIVADLQTPLLRP